MGSSTTPEWELPAGWEWVPIGELGEPIGGGTPSKKREDYWGGLIPWVSPKDMKSFSIRRTLDHITTSGLESSSAKLVPAGSVLVVFRSGILAHSLPVAVTATEVTINQDLKAIVPRNDIDPHYLAFALRAKADGILSWCVKRGATVHSIEASRFWAERLPIPHKTDSARSLDEQRRIVARIVALLERMQEARQLKVGAEADAELLLPAALLEVLNNTKSQYECATISKLIETGVLEVLGGGTPSKQQPAYWSGTIPWVSPKDMKRWIIDNSEDHITSEAVNSSSAKLIPKGAVLVVVRGMILARNWPVAIAGTELTINQDMKALCPHKNLDPRYLGYVLRGSEPEVLSQVETAAHGTKRLKTETLKGVQVPMPMATEQRRIVEYLDGVQAQVDELRRLQAASAAELERLEGAVLARAFRGEL